MIKVAVSIERVLCFSVTLSKTKPPNNPAENLTINIYIFEAMLL